jgi:hypothetical protein
VLELKFLKKIAALTKPGTTAYLFQIRRSVFTVCFSVFMYLKHFNNQEISHIREYFIRHAATADSLKSDRLCSFLRCEMYVGRVAGMLRGGGAGVWGLEKNQPERAANSLGGGCLWEEWLNFWEGAVLYFCVLPRKMAGLRVFPLKTKV